MVEINKKYKFQIGAYGNPFEGEVLGKTEKAFKVKLDKIITIAKIYHGLQLGKCIRVSPLMPYKEAGSTPTSRFFLFQNIYAGVIVGESLWRQDYVRKITTHLMYNNYFGRNSNHKYWYGEAREEAYRGIADTTASKKMKELKHLKNESFDEGSMTE